MPQRSGRIRPGRIEDHHERPPDPAEAANRPLEPKAPADGPRSRDAGDPRDPHHALNRPVGEVSPEADSDPYDARQDLHEPPPPGVFRGPGPEPDAARDGSDPARLDEALPGVRLDNVRLLTAEFGLAYAFYAEQLGLALRDGSAAGPYAEFSLGGAAIGLFDRDLMADALGLDPGPAVAPHASVIVLRVEDVDAAVATLRGRGLALEDAQDRPDWGVRTAYLRDPDGHLIELAADLGG
jgi:catechol 2,3-dioxygenase-like lactoylglutathione lyase family enzyme